MSRRITVPETHVGVLLHKQLASELLSLMLDLRRGKASEAAKAVAGDVALALISEGVTL